MATTWNRTLTGGVTIPTNTDITQLRTAINAERVRRRLGNATFTDTITNGSTPIKAVHITEQRTALNFAPLSLTDPTVTAGSTQPKAVHINELRAKVNALENAPVVGGTTGCNAGCTGLCVSCTGSCTGSCTSCTSCTSCSGCSGCSGSCEGTCSGCTSCTSCSGCSGCSGSCTGTCTGCSGSCSGSCAGCSSCTGTCTGSCAGCSGCSSCTGTCTGSCAGCTSCSSCTGTCVGDNCTCFVAGTLILMEDGSEKQIEDVQIGDRILGIDGQAHNVIYLDKTTLGNRSLLKFADNSLSWSEEHPLWTKFHNGEEYWGVWGYGAYLKEMMEENPDLPEQFQGFGLKKKLPRPIFEKGLSYAHISGWKKQNIIIDRTGYNTLPLYDLGTDGPGTMIANGYVVSAFATDKEFDFGVVKWNGITNKL